MCLSIRVYAGQRDRYVWYKKKKKNDNKITYTRMYIHTFVKSKTIYPDIHIGYDDDDGIITSYYNSLVITTYVCP